MKTLRLGPGFMLMALLCGCPDPTTDPGRRTLQPGQVGHAESGILFPEKIEYFSRGEIRTYDDEGLDVGVGYNMVNPANPITITVYVYPAPTFVNLGADERVAEHARGKMANQHFEGVKAEIRETYPGASLRSESEVSLSIHEREIRGRSAIYDLQGDPARFQPPRVSHAEVYAFGKWWIKLRATHPAVTEEQALVAIDAFKRSFCGANGLVGRQQGSDDSK